MLGVSEWALGLAHKELSIMQTQNRPLRAVLWSGLQNEGSLSLHCPSPLPSPPGVTSLPPSPSGVTSLPLPLSSGVIFLPLPSPSLAISDTRGDLTVLELSGNTIWM